MAARHFVSGRVVNWTWVRYGASRDWMRIAATLLLLPLIPNLNRGASRDWMRIATTLLCGSYQCLGTSYHWSRDWFTCSVS